MKRITNRIIIDVWNQMLAAGKLASCERVAIELEKKGYPRIRRQSIRFHLKKTEEGRALLSEVKPIRINENESRK